MWIRDRFRRLLNGIGIIGVLLALAPYFSSEAGVSGRSQVAHVEFNPDDMPTKEEYKFGWGRSPLVHYRSESALIEEDGQLLNRYTREFHVGWASLSSLTLVIGLGFLWLGSLLRSPARPLPSAIRLTC